MYRNHNYVSLSKVDFMKDIKERKINREDFLLMESAKVASSKAVRSSIALGLTMKVIKNNTIFSVKPDRTLKSLRTISKSKIDISGLKKGMILERK